MVNVYVKRKFAYSRSFRIGILDWNIEHTFANVAAIDSIEINASISFLVFPE